LQGAMGKDVLYDTMNREDLNWRKFHEQIAHKTVQTFKASGKKAYVVDDTVAQRFGKKMPGISSHFDHTSGRHMMGQQVLTLGLSCDEGFVPLDSELFISQTKAIELHEPHLRMVAVLPPSATGQPNNALSLRWSAAWLSVP
jgi:hypothetical protein